MVRFIFQAISYVKLKAVSVWLELFRISFLGISYIFLGVRGRFSPEERKKKRKHERTKERSDGSKRMDRKGRKVSKKERKKERKKYTLYAETLIL